MSISGRGGGTAAAVVPPLIGDDNGSRPIGGGDTRRRSISRRRNSGVRDRERRRGDGVRRGEVVGVGKSWSGVAPPPAAVSAWPGVERGVAAALEAGRPPTGLSGRGEMMMEGER
jgi:hypothetical protein